MAARRRSRADWRASALPTISAPLALLRYATLELGRRLAERNGIASAEDVFFLEPHEALAALREGGERRALVRTRHREHAWVKANPGPPRYGNDPGPPPDFRGLPREARWKMEALVTVIGLVFEAEESQRERAARSITTAPCCGRSRGNAARLKFYRYPSAAQKAASIDPAQNCGKRASPPPRRRRLPRREAVA